VIISEFWKRQKRWFKVLERDGQVVELHCDATAEFAIEKFEKEVMSFVHFY
jgi:hypothetical protein